jgi:hypothetical protein
MEVEPLRPPTSSWCCHQSHLTRWDLADPWSLGASVPESAACPDIIDREAGTSPLTRVSPVPAIARVGDRGIRAPSGMGRPAFVPRTTGRR